MPLTAPVQRLTSALATWADPSFLAPLGHVVDPEGPSGRVQGLAVPAAPSPAADLPLAPPPRAPTDRRVRVQRLAVPAATPDVVPALAADPAGTAVPESEPVPGPTWHLPATVPGAPRVEGLTTAGPVRLSLPARPVRPTLPVQRMPEQMAAPAETASEPVAEAPTATDDDGLPPGAAPEVSTGQAVVARDEPGGGAEPQAGDQEPLAPLVGSPADPTTHAMHESSAGPAGTPTVQRSVETTGAADIGDPEPVTALPVTPWASGSPSPAVPTTAAATTTPEESAPTASPRGRRSRIGEPLAGPVDLQRLVAPLPPASTSGNLATPPSSKPLVGDWSSVEAGADVSAVGASVQRASEPVRRPDLTPSPLAAPLGAAAVVQRHSEDGRLSVPDLTPAPITAPPGFATVAQPPSDEAPSPVPVADESPSLSRLPAPSADAVAAPEPTVETTDGPGPRPEPGSPGTDAVEVAPLIAQRPAMVSPGAAVQRDADETATAAPPLPTRSVDGAAPVVPAGPGGPSSSPGLRPPAALELVPVQRSVSAPTAATPSDVVRRTGDGTAASGLLAPLPTAAPDIPPTATADPSPVADAGGLPDLHDAAATSGADTADTTAVSATTWVPDGVQRSDSADAAPAADPPPAAPLVLAPVLAVRPTLGGFLPGGAPAPAVQRVAADQAPQWPDAALSAPAMRGARAEPASGGTTPLAGRVVQRTGGAGWPTPTVQRSADRVVQLAGDAYQRAPQPPAPAPVRWVSTEPHLAPAMSGTEATATVATSAPGYGERPGPQQPVHPAAVQRSTADPVSLGRIPDGRREAPPVLRTAPGAAAVLQRVADPGAVAVARGLGHRDADGSVVFSPAPDGGEEPAVQRSEEAPAVQRVDDVVPELEGAPSAPGPTTAAPGGTPGTPPASSGTPDMDELARRLFDPLSARLRAELRLDRERAGISTDLRH